MKRWCRQNGIAVCVLIGSALSLGHLAWAQPPVTTESPLEVGQRISLDLKGVDILDVLKLFSQKSGLNFVAGRNVSGRVTIFVKDVDVWDAFDLIVGANDLAYERRGDIVTVMMARDYELLYGEKFQERKQSFVHPLRYAKVVQVATVLNQIKSAVGRVVADEATNTLILSDVPARLAEMKDVLKQLDRPTETRVYQLKYAEAEKLKEKVQEFLSPVGTFTFDARTNTAVVSDLPEVLLKTDRLVRAFDAAEGQVLIEAKIVKVSLTDQMQTGIDWQQIFGGDLTARSNFRVLSDIVGGTAKGAALKLFTGPDDKTQIILEALKKLTKTETLANPRIMVSNNQEAKILVGKKDAIVSVTTTVPATGSTVQAPQIEFVDVGTKLFVTPNIKRDGYVQLKIRPEVSTSVASTPVTGVSVPIVSTTEAETNVLVKSGVTLIIGGLIETKHELKNNRVPLLGDMPLVGKLFQDSDDLKEKTETVVFLTPQVVLPDGSPFVPPPEPEAADAPSESEQSVVMLGDPVPPIYRRTIRQRLQDALANQFRAASLQKGSVSVSFVLNHLGQVVGRPAIESPEGAPFIEAAHTALAQAEPFPPFPEAASSNEVRFRIVVEYAP